MSIVLVSLLPVGIVAPYYYKTAWDQQYQQLIEKHQLLAQNLAEPLQMYINSHQQSLKILASTINQLPYQELDQLQPIIEQSVQYLDGFNAISLLSVDGKLKAISVHDDIQQQAKIPDYSKHPLFSHLLENQVSDISDVHPSFITGEPGIVMSQAVMDEHGKTRAILFAELDLQPLDDRRKCRRLQVFRTYHFNAPHIINEHVSRSTHHSSRRHAQQYFIPSTNTLHYRRFFFVRTAKDWNCLLPGCPLLTAPAPNPGKM